MLLYCWSMHQGPSADIFLVGVCQPGHLSVRDVCRQSLASDAISTRFCVTSEVVPGGMVGKCRSCCRTARCPCRLELHTMQTHQRPLDKPWVLHSRSDEVFYHGIHQRCHRFSYSDTSSPNDLVIANATQAENCHLRCFWFRGDVSFLKLVVHGPR